MTDERRIWGVWWVHDGIEEWAGTTPQTEAEAKADARAYMAGSRPGKFEAKVRLEHLARFGADKALLKSVGLAEACNCSVSLPGASPETAHSERCPQSPLYKPSKGGEVQPQRKEADAPRDGTQQASPPADPPQEVSFGDRVPTIEDFMLPGWVCTHGHFNGAAKQARATCRVCDEPATKDAAGLGRDVLVRLIGELIADNLTLSQAHTEAQVAGSRAVMEAQAARGDLRRISIACGFGPGLGTTDEPEGALAKVVLRMQEHHELTETVRHMSEATGDERQKLVLEASQEATRQWKHEHMEQAAELRLALERLAVFKKALDDQRGLNTNLREARIETLLEVHAVSHHALPGVGCVDCPVCLDILAKLERDDARHAETPRDASIDVATRALLDVEWSGDLITCPHQDCGAPSGWKYASGKPRAFIGKHLPRCPIDQALTAAGLDTDEKRGNARLKHDAYTAPVKEPPTGLESHPGGRNPEPDVRF